MLMRFPRNLPLVSVLFFALQGCTRSFDGGWDPIFLYRIDIQQGNLIEQRMLDKLKPGMDKEKVLFIMGSPIIIDPFHSNLWEYIYSYQEGGNNREQLHITLHFEGEKLAYISGDIRIGDPNLEESEEAMPAGKPATESEQDEEKETTTAEDK